MWGNSAARVVYKKYFKRDYFYAARFIYEHVAEKIIKAGEKPEDYYSPDIVARMGYSRPKPPESVPSRTAPAAEENPAGTTASVSRRTGTAAGGNPAGTTANVPRRSGAAARRNSPDTAASVPRRTGTAAGRNPGTAAGRNPAPAARRNSPDTAANVSRRSGAVAGGNPEVRLKRMLKRRLSLSPLTRYSTDPFAYILNPGRR
jgi:hypothetical protein